MGINMKWEKSFLVSFIPKHVSNRISLKVYQILTIVPVPRKTRENNYNSNVVEMNKTKWNFWTVPTALIENQNEWGNIMYGAGKHHNMRYSGCEIIATFNARKVLTGICSPESMAALISEFEADGAALRGEFGVSPRAIEKYFKKHGFLVATTDQNDEKSLKMVDSKCQVMIATVYNDANNIMNQVHTVCITKDAGNAYVLHNAYCRDINGAYTASAPYATLSEAISHISRYGAKLIYLIGICLSHTLLQNIVDETD